MVLIAGCGKKQLEKEAKVAEAQKIEAQKELNNVFISVPTQKLAIELLAPKMEETNGFFIVIPKGEFVKYEFKGKMYEGNLPENSFGFFGAGKITLANGALIKSKVKLAKKEPTLCTVFEEEYLVKELRPIFEKFELSIFWKETGQRMFDSNFIEFFLNDQDTIIVRPRPRCILKIEDKTYLIGQDYKLWRTKEESAAARSK